MKKLLVTSFIYLTLLFPALAQAIPFPGPGGVAGAAIVIGTPVALGTPVFTGGTPSSVSMVTTQNIVSGDLVVIGTAVRSNILRTYTGCTDGTNTYTQAAGANGGDASDTMNIWYKENAAAVSSGATITCTLNAAVTGASNGAFLFANRVTGILTSSSLDQTATNNTTAPTATVTSGTLSQSNEIAFGITGTWGASATVSAEGASYTNSGFINGVAGGLNLAYRIVAATTAQTYAPTWTGTSTVSTSIATYKGF